MDDQFTGMSSVAHWLDQVHIAEPEQEPEPETGDQSPRCHAKKAPVTPIRKPQPVQLYTEASPTDTNFSDDNIFDSPHGTVVATSPIRPSRRALRAIYAETEASSIDDDEAEDVDDDTEHVKPSSNNSATLVPASLNSYDPPSSAAGPAVTINDDVLISSPRIVAPASNLICIVSCLQCVLANLPCSRTHPSCTRCTRNGHAALCLLQRRRTVREIWHTQEGFATAPVLLRSEGETDGGWEGKVELRERLLEEWRGRVDRRNWVLPSWTAAGKGGVGDNGGVGVGGRGEHPGEGVGRVVFWDMKAGRFTVA